MKKKLIINSRKYRVYHRRVGLAFLFFLVLVSITGFLLGLKDTFKLKPEVPTIEDYNSKEWITLTEINNISRDYVYKELKYDTVIDRIDFRPKKNVVKVLFKNHFTELQINVYSGEILSVNTRLDTIIEKIHDGSIIDYYFTNSNISRVIYTVLLFTGIIFMSLSGYFLWYYPKKIKRLKNQ